jgi:hypothetical protein
MVPGAKVQAALQGVDSRVNIPLLSPGDPQFQPSFGEVRGQPNGLGVAPQRGFRVMLRDQQIAEIGENLGLPRADRQGLA